MIVALPSKPAPEDERFCSFQRRYMSSIFIILGFASVAFWADLHNQSTVTTTKVASRYVFSPAQRAYEWGRRIGRRRIYHRDFRDTSAEEFQTLSLWSPARERQSIEPHQRLLLLSDLWLRNYDDQALEGLLHLLNKKMCELRGGGHPYVIRVHGGEETKSALTGRPGLMQHFLEMSDWIAYQEISQLLAGRNDGNFACFRDATSSIILRDDERLMTGDSILVKSDKTGRRWLEIWSELEQRAALESDGPIDQQGRLMESILQAFDNNGEMLVGSRCDRKDKNLFRACYEDIYSQLAGPYSDSKFRSLFDGKVKLDPLFPIRSGCNSTGGLPLEDPFGSFGPTHQTTKACINQTRPFFSGATLKPGYYIYLPYAGELHYCTKERGDESSLFPLNEQDRIINRLGAELTCLKFSDLKYHHG